VLSIAIAFLDGIRINVSWNVSLMKGIAAAALTGMVYQYVKMAIIALFKKFGETG